MEQGVVPDLAAEVLAEVAAEAAAAAGLGYRSQIWLVVPVVQAQ
jgi:hypothetical protein